jgi:hypothetical protein
VPYVLLTTVCRPFGGNGEGHSVGAELFHAQVTRSQGIFSYRQVIRCWGLDYIAEKNFVMKSKSNGTTSSASILSLPPSTKFNKWRTSYASTRPGQKLFSADMEPFCPMMSFALIAILSVGKKASVLCAGF